MSNLDRCSWKLVSPDKFVMGQVADRCGDIADVVVLRPNRKTDLFLCEEHMNEFIAHWGLHNKVEILCRCGEEVPQPHGWCETCGCCERPCDPCHIDPAPAPLVADPAMMIDRISRGSKVPKKRGSK